MATFKKKNAVQITKNFESTEFDCKCKNYCATTEIDLKLVQYLQMIRDHFGKPVTINSAYRCEKHNKNIGGASKSKHLYGQAADIKVHGVAPLKVAQYAESIGVKGIGQYSNFVHIDTREKKFFWYGNEQDSRNTFGKYVDSSGNDDSKQEFDAGSTSKSKAVVTGDSVNIRKGPGTNYATIGKVALKGDEFEVPEVNGWTPIIIDKQVSWISSKYVKAN